MSPQMADCSLNPAIPLVGGLRSFGEPRSRLNAGAAMSPIQPISGLVHTFEWSALYSAVVLAVILLLLATSMVVALVADDEKRAIRALKIFKELLRLFRRGSK
jgi:hypothetical protein